MCITKIERNETKRNKYKKEGRRKMINYILNLMGSPMLLSQT